MVYAVHRFRAKYSAVNAVGAFHAVQRLGSRYGVVHAEDRLA